MTTSNSIRKSSPQSDGHFVHSAMVQAAPGCQVSRGISGMCNREAPTPINKYRNLAPHGVLAGLDQRQGRVHSSRGEGPRPRPYGAPDTSASGRDPERPAFSPSRSAVSASHWVITVLTSRDLNNPRNGFATRLTTEQRTRCRPAAATSGPAQPEPNDEDGGVVKPATAPASAREPTGRRNRRILANAQ